MNDKSNHKLASMQIIAKSCYGQLYIQDNNQDNLRTCWAFLFSPTYILTDAANVLNVNLSVQTVLFKIQIDGKSFERTCDAKAFPKETSARQHQQFALLSLEQPIIQAEQQVLDFVSLISQSSKAQIEEYISLQRGQDQIDQISVQLQISNKRLQSFGKTIKLQEDIIQLSKRRIDKLEKKLAKFSDDSKLKFNSILEGMKQELKQKQEKIKGLQQSSLSLNLNNSIFTNQLEVNQGIVKKIKKTGQYSSMIFSLPLSSKTVFQCGRFNFNGKSPIVFGLISEGLLNRPFSTSKKDEAISIRFIFDPQDNQLQMRIPGQQKIILEVDPSIIKGQPFKIKLCSQRKNVIFQMGNNIEVRSLGPLSNKCLFPFVALFEERSSIEAKYKQ